MTTQTWRVVVEGGEIREVPVEDSAPTWGLWYAVRANGEACGGRTPRHAVTTLCAAEGWPVVEIRGPGEATTAEAVEAEREECARACEAIADAPESSIEECRGAFSCTDAIRARTTP
jgi:hypothetical protein